MRWLLLGGAILTEVTAALALQAAVDAPGWYALVVAGYLAAFGFLTRVLKAGMAVGVAYGVWGASGVALTALGATVLFAAADRPHDPRPRAHRRGRPARRARLAARARGPRRRRILGGRARSLRAHHPDRRAQLMAWLLLAIAIVTEVAATISLKLATDGRRRWYAVVAVGYVTAFSMLAGALSLGLPIGVAYGIWAATGVALTAILGRVLFRDPLTRTMLAGIALIIGGVLLIELGH
jgi:small multidrug resistance pump